MKKINDLDKKIDKIISNDLEHIRQGQEEILELLRGNKRNSDDVGIIGRVKALESRTKMLVGGVVFAMVFVLERVVDYIMKL